MAQAVRELLDTAPGNQLSFDEKLGMIVDREWTERDNRRLSRRLKEAKLSSRASLDNVTFQCSRVRHVEPGRNGLPSLVVIGHDARDATDVQVDRARAIGDHGDHLQGGP